MALINSTDVAIRPVRQEDVSFIMSSWKRSWRVCPWAGVVRNDEFYDSIRSTIDGLIARGSTLLVACLPSSPDRILGWVCFEALPDGLCCVHYLYVKDPYLKMGIGEKLVEECTGAKPGLYTFRYRQVVEACQGWAHAPEVARRR